MDLHKIVAENMHRFGTKNLSDTDRWKIANQRAQQLNEIKTQLLTEASTIPVGTMPDTEKVLSRAYTLFQSVDWLKSAAEAVEKACANRNIEFSSSYASAGLVLVLGGQGSLFAQRLAKYAQYNKKFRDKVIQKLSAYKDVNVRNKLKTMGMDFSGKFRNVEVFSKKYKRNLAKLKNPKKQIPLVQYKGKSSDSVLTKGYISSTGYDDATTVSASSIKDLCRYFNDINLDTSLKSVMFDKKVRPYWGSGGNEAALFVPTEGAEKGQFQLDKFVYGPFGTFFSDGAYTEATGGTTIQPLHIEDIITGPLINFPLKGKLFDTGKIAVTAELTNQVKTQYAAAQKLAKDKGGQITKAVITSGASSGRPVKGTPENFAASVGMNVNDVPTADKLGKDTPGKVTDPKASGNAFLAWYRGVAAEAELKKAGFNGTIEKQPEIGGAIGKEIEDQGAAMDAQQFVRLGFEIKVADKIIDMTKDDINRSFSAGGGKSGQLILHEYRMK